MKDLIEALEFLKCLGEEMTMQDTDSQADPRFWVVTENKRDYGIADGYEDGIVCCGSDGATFDTVGELIEYLIENDYLSEGDYDGGAGMTFEDVLNDLDDSQFYVTNYRDMRDQIAPNTMFLTKQECKEHIKRNHYHYKEPHTYAMTAWRSPQVEKLYDILKNMDWDSLISALKDSDSE